MEQLGLTSQEVWMTEDIFARVFPAFVEAVHVELSDEGVYITVSEVFGENMILEVIDLFDGEFPSVDHPMDDPFVVFVLKDLKTFLYKIRDRIVVNLVWHSLVFLNFYSLNKSK